MTAQPIAINRKIARPYSKLTRLCGEAKRRGGALTTFALVAKAIALSPGRVTQVFGYGQDAEGTYVKGEIMLAKIAAVFTSDGVPCEIDWFYLEFEDFAARLTAPGGGQAAPVNDPAKDKWELGEATVLRDLVELRLHPPRPGNEVQDSLYVDATLLFGTAVVDCEPEDGEEPRSVAIALRTARLAIGSDSYRPLPGSMLGEDGRESPNLKRVSGGVEITGPAPSGTLDGNPIGNQHLAVIAGTNAEEEPFAVTVASPRRSFVVTDADAQPSGDCGCDMPEANRADTKQVILNEFIYSRAKVRDDANRVILALATMQRRPEGDGHE